MTNKKPFPNLGIGIGLRPFHYEEIMAGKCSVDWFEIISENFMVEGGKPLDVLSWVLDHFPVVQHGVNLAIGSPDPLDWDYLKKLKKLTRLTKTPWLSDHLCWGRLKGAHFHDLLPLPFTKEVVDYVACRAIIVQDFLEIPFALENLSSYIAYTDHEMTEWDFYREIVERAGIYMMLDVNNIYVSSCNHHFDPHLYLKNIPFERVIQIHLAGHMNQGSYLLDTHDCKVIDPVWKLYGEIYPLTNQASTLLEWDDNFIDLESTCQEALKAKSYQEQLLCTI